MKRKKNMVATFYKRRPNGSYVAYQGHPVSGFWGAVLELWRFWRRFGTGLDDYDQMTLTFL